MEANPTTQSLTANAVTQVFIVEDDKKLREAFTDLVNSHPNMACAAYFSSCRDLLEYLLIHKSPDVIIMDIELPGMNGIEGVKHVKKLYPSIDILMLTVYNDDDRIFQSICAGAGGYLLKSARPAELLHAIENIKTGAPMSASIARRVMDIMRSKHPTPNTDFSLTFREKEILQGLVDGLTYKQIGIRLFISPKTVQSFIKIIYEKLQVHSKSAAVSKALKYKLF